MLSLGLAALTLAAVAACGGGGRAEALTAEEYFPRVEALLEEQETRAEALGERYSRQLDVGATSLEQALAAALPLLPVMLAELRPITSDVLTGLEDIVPPPEAEEAHLDLVSAYRDLLTLMDDLAARLQRGEGGADAFAVMFAEASGTELGQRLSTALADLERVATANGIAVQLTTIVSTSGTQPPVQVAGVPVGPGLSVADAIASTLEGPLLVNGFIFMEAGDVWLCDSLLHGDPLAADLSKPGSVREEHAMCGEPSIEVSGLDPAIVESFEFHEGAGWTNEATQVLGSKIDGVLTVSGTMLAR